MSLTCEELLRGAAATHEVAIPAEVLQPANGAHASLGTDADGALSDSNGGARVTLRPLALADIQLIHQAAQDSRALTSALMVQHALVDPKVTIDDVNHMHAGLVEFLLHEVNRISGLALGAEELEEAVRSPLARACFVLAREFGWSPEECARLTVGQVLLYLEMLGKGEGRWSTSSG